MLPELNKQQETELIQRNFSQLRKNFPLYAFLNLKIKNKQAQVVRFTLNKLQKKLWLMVKECLENEKPIRMYFVKSRQTGSTTFWLGLIFWLTTLWKNRNVIMLAQDDDTAEGIGDKMQNYYLRSNQLLKPNARKINRKEIYFANSLEDFEKTGDIGLDCHIDNSTANKANLGRSYTYQIALLTEFGLWEEQGIDVKKTLSPLLQTIPKIPETMIVIETTAKGEGFAKDFYEDDTNGFTKVFISWIADDSYRIDLPFGQYFDLSDSEDSKFGDEVTIKSEIENQLLYWDVSNNFKNNPLALHHEAMCRIAWRRETISEKCFGDLATFKQEYPLTVADAFSSTASFVFPVDKIEEMLTKIKDQNLTSNNFNFDFDKAELNVKDSLIPYKHGKIKIYEQPQSNGLYVIGCDGAQGITGGDSSSLIVLRVPEMYECASFEDIITPTEFADLASALSRYYNNALLGIEDNDKGGYAAINSIRERYPSTNLYFRRTSAIPSPKSIRYGWHTGESTRSVMIEDLKALLRYYRIEIYNPKILEQMRSFVKLPSGKLAAAKGKHDDLVLALMIAVQMARKVTVNRDNTLKTSPPKGSLDYLVKQMEQRRKRLRMRAA